MVAINYEVATSLSPPVSRAFCDDLSIEDMTAVSAASTITRSGFAKICERISA